MALDPLEGSFIWEISFAKKLCTELFSRHSRITKNMMGSRYFWKRFCTQTFMHYKLLELLFSTTVDFYFLWNFLQKIEVNLRLHFFVSSSRKLENTDTSSDQKFSVVHYGVSYSLQIILSVRFSSCCCCFQNCSIIQFFIRNFVKTAGDTI